MRFNVLKVLGMYQVHKKHPKINGANIIFKCYIQTMSPMRVLRLGGNKRIRIG